MSDTIPTPMTTDPTGTAQPVGTVPSASNVPTPATAAVPTTPQDSTNAPDAQTPAAKSIPANLVNNPQVPSQKLATQADANKNSPAPWHTMLRHAAIEMLGGQQYRTDYKTDGTAVRTPVEPSLAHLGLALAAEIVKGGLAGGNAKDTVAAAQAGQASAAKDAAARKQASIDQDAQAKADQNHKLAVVKNNLETHQLALNVGKQGLEMNKAYVKGYEDTANMLEHHRDLIKDDVTGDKIQDAMKKYHVTRDMFIPHGDPFAVLDPTTGKQREDENHVPLWENNYYVVDAKGKGVLTQELQDMMYKNGKMRGPDGERVNVPTNSEYPMAAIGKYAVENAQIQTAEEQLEDHKNDLLGDKAGPRVSLADSVASDSKMMDAVKDYSRFLGRGDIDDVFAAMMENGKGDSAARLMKFMGVTPDDVRDFENQKAKEAAEAKNVKPTGAETDAEKRLDILTKDPINAVNADSIIAAHNKPTADIVIPEDRYNQAIAFNAQKAKQKGAEESASAEARTKAESDVGDIPTLAKNIVSGDFSNVGDVTSYRGGQRIALTNALHDAAIAAGKNPNDFAPGALKAKTAMYQDYHNNKTGTGANITAFDAFLGHSGDALDANADWKRTKSPLLNQPLNWIATNATNDPNYVKFTTALEPVRKEFMSFLNANRAEHEADIKTMQTVLDDNKSPLQIETALKQLGNSADIRLAAMARTYQRTMGRPFEGLITPHGQAALTKMGIIPSSYSKVGIPGQKPFYVPPEKGDAVKAKYPNAVITER